MSKRLYRIHLQPEPEGGFTVTVPVLPGCVTWGEDHAHAMAMAQEAIEGYLEMLLKQGEAIPNDDIDCAVDALVEVAPPISA